MTSYLIAHKVRGEAAFDVAERMDCPICNYGAVRDSEGLLVDCAECDGLGYWWIISTSGHRAYPYWDVPINYCTATKWDSTKRIYIEDHPLPDVWPDHYPCNKSPASQPLIHILGLLRKEPKVTRR